MHFPFQKRVKISDLPRPPVPPPTEIRPNNPNPSERDPRPGRYSIVGPFIKLSDFKATTLEGARREGGRLRTSGLTAHGSLAVA